MLLSFTGMNALTGVHLGGLSPGVSVRRPSFIATSVWISKFRCQVRVIIKEKEVRPINYVLMWRRQMLETESIMA